MDDWEINKKIASKEFVMFFVLVDFSIRICLIIDKLSIKG